MYAKSEDPPQWTVHAEFTISHKGVNDPNNLPETHLEREGNGVRMTYIWTSPSDGNAWTTHSNHPPTYTSPTNEDVGKESHSTYQKGNMLFSSTPSRLKPKTVPNTASFPGSCRSGTAVQDSGYSTELLTPSSFINATLPRRQQPYNRKCKSTCSIILSTAFNDTTIPADASTSSQCGRTQSLRCQTPSVRGETKETKYYGCGDPWCYHSNYAEDSFSGGRFSPVPETSEDRLSSKSTKVPSSTGSLSTVRVKNSLPPQKDVSVQTLDMVDKSTSPYMRPDCFGFSQKEDKEEKFKKNKSFKKRCSSRSSGGRTHSPSSFTPDSLENQQVNNKVYYSLVYRVT